MPKTVTQEMLGRAVFWLNSFPYAARVFEGLSPRAIVTGREVDFNLHGRWELGEYMHVHEESNNTMVPRTVGAIALRPTGNAQGSWLFMSPNTGRVLARDHATKLPMPSDAINRVLELAKRQKATQGLTFADRNGRIPSDDYIMTDDDEDDEEYVPMGNEDLDTLYYDDAIGMN
jgi:hypothetical protein